jgi:peptide/nickel transport system substrate-binding protein
MSRALAASAALMLATACFSPAGETSSSQATGSQARVSVAMLQVPRSGLSPYSDDAFMLTRWGVTETLVALDETGDPVPGLATRWRQVEPRTWRFTLRTGVHFHDGTAMTSARVVDSLRQASQASPAPRILDGVDLTVRAVGRSVEMRTTRPDPLLPERLSSPQLPILAARAYRGDAVDVTRAATGPFVLVDSQGASGATVNRNDRYWRRPARLAGIDVTYVPDGTARGAALPTGEADIVESVPVAQASLLEPSSLTGVPTARTSTLYLNTSTEPFASPAMRALARESVNRRELVAGIYEGRADVGQGLLGPALSWTRARKPSSPQGPVAEDARGAKIVIATYTDRPEMPEALTVLEQQLEGAGFEVEQVVREYAQIEADMLDGRFDAFLLSRATVLDSGDPVAYLQSDFTCDGSFNISNLCDKRVDRLVSAAAQASAGPARQRAILRAEAAILDTDAAVPLLHERVIQGVAPDIAGVAHDPRERLLVTAQTHRTP